MPETFADRLRQARLAKHYSLHTLTRAAMVSPGYVWELEEGHITHPDAATLRRLAQALNVSAMWLFAGQEDT